jgi:aminoglycoside phosphotransferase (APT) family kinase protein
VVDRRGLIAEALGREPTTLVEIDVGYDYDVAIVDDEWVFRFPTREVVERALERELVLLPELAAALPVEVPSFEFVSRDPLFVGYPLIRGEPLVDEDPEGVRAFLAALHGYDASGLPIDRPDWVEIYREHCRRFEERVFPLLDEEERAAAQRLFAEVETLSDYEPVLTHSDLGPEHLLVRDGRLRGVIDWGDARLGDPALDYAFFLNGPFAHWAVDADLRRRARFYHRLAPWYDVHYAIFTGRRALIDRGLTGVRARLHR